MRTTQFVGLTSDADNWLKENVRITKRRCSCPDCQHEHITEVVEEEYDITYGMCEDSFPLNKYQLKSGEWVYEYVQADPWSSGPVIFLALRQENGSPIPESLWSQEEIDQA